MAHLGSENLRGASDLRWGAVTTVLTVCCVVLAGLGLVRQGDELSLVETRLEPDHLYVWVSHGAPEGRLLRDLGILQYPDTARPGEGVEWITFAFENIYLELLWVVDEARFRETWGAYHPAHIHRARWAETGSSPFGLAFHRVDSGAGELPSAFQGNDWWDARGGYVSDADAQMPFLMVMGSPYAMPNPSWMTPGGRALADNPAGISRLTSWTLGAPEPLDHEIIQVLVDQGALRVRRSSRHVMELTFDEGQKGQMFDARPELPLIIRY